MKVYLWLNNCEWLNQLVLFDGENTYWSDEMRPSGGYFKETIDKYRPDSKSQFFYIGEL